jgi:outer membrane protein insertion porin family
LARQGVFTSILLSLALATRPAPVRAGDSTNWGKPVESISLQCDAGLKIANVTGNLPQKVGQPLDPSKVADSLKALYATGRFTDLRAEAQPSGDGVSLIFVGRVQYYAGTIRVEGAPSSVEGQGLVTASRLRLGQALFEKDLDDAQKRIVAVLASNGYYQARVDLEIDRDPDSEEANIVFMVSAGRPARVSSVVFSGHTAFPPARLMKVAGWRNSMHLTSARQERGHYKLHQFYIAQGRLQATVSTEKRIYDPKLNTEKLQIRVEAGPLIQVRFEGAKLRLSKLRELLPVFHDGIVDDFALTRGELNLEDYFQRRGYLTATVKAERKSQPNSQRIDLLFHVNLGEQMEFAGYAVKGNRSIPTEDLMATLSPPTQGLLPPAPQFSRELLTQKVNGLKRRYLSQGFQSVQISPVIDKQFEGNPARWFVTFEIQEGPRTTVRQLTLVGVDSATQKSLGSSMLTLPNHAYSPDRATMDRNFIADYLADRGYTQATVTWNATPVPSPYQVDLEYRIILGPQERIQRIFLLGNQHTRAGIIDRELLFQDGEPLSQSKLLESQRQLYDLGIFNQVQMATQAQPPSQTERTVLVGVEEGRRWALSYGGGLEVQKLGSNNPAGQYKASPRLSLDLTRLNVGGRAQTFSMRGRLSDLERGGAVNYFIPRLMNRRDLRLRLNGLVDRSQEVLTFTDDRREGSVSLERLFSPTTWISARYIFRRVQALNISDRVSPEQRFILSRKARVGMVGSSYVNDHRDDPADATRGSYSLFDAGVAAGQFGSEANFIRITGQNATYYLLAKHLVFARNTRLGIESPYGGLREIVENQAGQPPTIVFTHDIPLPERFFMGGSESHRGFSINQAGPRDPTTGFPVGGNSLFLNTFELRIPLAERRLGLVFFHDAGNVYSTVRKMRLFKVTQNSPTDLNYTVHAVGAGIRYKTPVAPVRFDVGYSLNPPKFQTISSQNGANLVGVQRLPQFQFFFSIGQSF